MKIKVIANKPPLENCSDISELIGKEFDTVKFSSDNNFDDNKYNNSVCIEELDLIIFEDEYEIIED